MNTPRFILELRRKIGHDPLWLMSATVICLRESTNGTEVLLERRADNGLWATIGGIVDPGEHPAEAARREAKEEVGVDVEVGRMLWCTVGERFTYPNGDIVQYVDHGFAGRVVGGHPHVADSESVDVGWFPVDALPEPRTDKLQRVVEIAVENPCDVVLSLDA